MVLEGVEMITNLLVQYEIHEKLYLREDTEATAQLRDSLVELYVSMLSFLAKAKRFYDKSTVSKCNK